MKLSEAIKASTMYGVVKGDPKGDGEVVFKGSAKKARLAKQKSGSGKGSGFLKKLTGKVSKGLDYDTKDKVIDFK